MGPLQMSDLAGLDVGAFVRRERGLREEAAASGARYYGELPDQLVKLGRLGQKSKAGWYDYSAGRAPVDDAAVEELILAHSAAHGYTRRAVSTDEVLDRCPNY